PARTGYRRVREPAGSRTARARRAGAARGGGRAGGGHDAGMPPGWGARSRAGGARRRDVRGAVGDLPASGDGAAPRTRRAERPDRLRWHGARLDGRRGRWGARALRGPPRRGGGVPGAPAVAGGFSVVPAMPRT